MGSLFDSKVYSTRRAYPWAEINLELFAKEAALSGSEADRKLPEAADAMLHKWNYHSGENDFRLTVQYRPDVASRFWFTVEWTGEDGGRHEVSAQELSLCMWRAAVAELEIRERVKRDREIRDSKESPIPMILNCPQCSKQHIDRDEWAARPHRTHLCEHCGYKWRPDERYTVGVSVQELVSGRSR